MSDKNLPARQTPLEKIKSGLISKNTLAMFADTLPNVAGEHAVKAAKRYAKMVYTTIAQNPSLQKCTFVSILKAASMSASLDLDIDARGLAYLVPYKNQAQFQIGYMGLIELAYRSGKVKAISAHCVYEGEKDTVKIVRLDGQFKVEHPFSYDAPTGKIIAVYATAEVDGLGPVTTVLRKDEIERFRKLSKCPGSPAWKDHYEAMAKKTAIRQLAKFLPKSILEDFARAAAMDEKQDFVDAAQEADKTIKDETGREIIDADFEGPDPALEAKKKAAIEKLELADAKAKAEAKEKAEAEAEEPTFLGEED